MIQTNRITAKTVQPGDIIRWRHGILHRVLWTAGDRIYCLDPWRQDEDRNKLFVRATETYFDGCEVIGSVPLTEQEQRLIQCLFKRRLIAIALEETRVWQEHTSTVEALGFDSRRRNRWHRYRAETVYFQHYAHVPETVMRERKMLRRYRRMLDVEICTLNKSIGEEHYAIQA